MQRSGAQEPQPEHLRDKERTRYQELRELLTGPEQRLLAGISKRLDDPVRRAQDLEQVLPDAIILATEHDGGIVRALQPIMDTALKASARKNPKVLADAIFPALGPAIRKAISAALTGMVQSLNYMLNQSFSWQGLKWRLEALRTRKPFAEVILLHTLVYRVEQIFLIHRRSGLLLQHAVAENIQSKDPDLVSGMLTAIQDFVKDSFDTKTGEMLDTLRMDGDHSVWIEHGPDAVLAAVIRGLPPVELRTRFRDLLNRMHRLYGDALDTFDGQTSSFAMIKPDLEDALTLQLRQQRKLHSPLLAVLAAAGLSLGLVWAHHAFENQRHWENLVAQLRNHKGIMLTAARKTNGFYHIAGFRDPLAREVEKMIAQSGLDPDRVQTRWQPFFALDEATILDRAGMLLRPPPTVRLTLVNGTLTATGHASHQWVRHFHLQAGAVPGILGFNETGLIDADMRLLRLAVDNLERHKIYFDLGKAQLKASQATILTDSLKALRQIQKLGTAMGVAVRIAVIGQTDPSGPQAFNLQLSQLRAQAVLGYLIRNKIDPSNMYPVGSTTQPLGTESTPAGELQAFRCAIFKVFIGTE